MTRREPATVSSTACGTLTWLGSELESGLGLRLGRGTGLGFGLGFGLGLGLGLGLGFVLLDLDARVVRGAGVRAARVAVGALLGRPG